jgi:hypothetical protein
MDVKETATETTTEATPAAAPVAAKSAASTEIVDPGEALKETVGAPADDKNPGETTDETTDANSGGLDEDLKQRASEYGFSEEDLAGMDAKTVEAAIGAVDRRLARGQEPQAQPPVQAQAQAAAAQAQQIKELILELPDDIDPSIVKALKTLQTGFNEQAKQLQQALGLATNHQQAVAYLSQESFNRQQEQVESQFDKTLDNLGEDYKAVLGVTAEIKPGSPQFKQREEIWNTTRALLAGYQVNGIRNPGFAEVTRRAVGAVLGGRGIEIARNKLNKEVQARRSQAIARPRAGGQKAPLDPEQRAVTNIAARLDKINHS